MEDSRSDNLPSTNSRNTTFESTRVMDFSSLAKTLSLNLTLKLDHSNYVYWKAQVLTAIEALDLEGFVNGEKSPPPKVITVRSGEVEEQRENPDFVKWKKSDKLLMSWIFSTLTPSVLGQVTNSKSSFEVWSKIERTFSQRSLARIMQLKQQLQSVKKGSDSISDLVVKIRAISDALLAAGEVVSDRDMIMSLLQGVGHEYDSVVTLISSQQNSMSLEDAQFLFLMHEQRIEHLNSNASLTLNPSAQFASSGHNVNNNRGSFDNRGGFNSNSRGSSRGRNRGGGRTGGRGNQRIFCQLCGKSGHVVLQCYRRFDQQYHGPVNQQHQGNRSGQGSQANHGQGGQVFYTGYQVQAPYVQQQSQNNLYDQGVSQVSDNASAATQNSAFFATPETVSDPNWYVDSGATNHVTSNLNNLSVRSEYRGPENQESSSSRYS